MAKNTIPAVRVPKNTFRGTKTETEREREREDHAHHY